MLLASICWLCDGGLRLLIVISVETVYRAEKWAPECTMSCVVAKPHCLRQLTTYSGIISQVTGSAALTVVVIQVSLSEA